MILLLWQWKVWYSIGKVSNYRWMIDTVPFWNLLPYHIYKVYPSLHICTHYVIFLTGQGAGSLTLVREFPSSNPSESGFEHFVINQPKLTLEKILCTSHNALLPIQYFEQVVIWVVGDETLIIRSHLNLVACILGIFCH